MKKPKRKTLDISELFNCEYPKNIAPNFPLIMNDVKAAAKSLQYYLKKYGRKHAVHLVLDYFCTQMDSVTDGEGAHFNPEDNDL